MWQGLVRCFVGVVEAVLSVCVVVERVEVVFQGLWWLVDVVGSSVGQVSEGVLGVSCLEVVEWF